MNTPRRAHDGQPIGTGRPLTKRRLNACRLLRGTSALVLVVLIAAACSFPGKQQAPARLTYLLQGSTTSASPPAAEARRCLSLRVSTPESAPGFGTSRMAYTKQPPRLDYFAFNEWVDTPARMLAAMMETQLDASGLLGAVLTGSADLRTDLRLDSELKWLQQDFSGGNSSLRLAVKLALIDVPNRKLLDSKTFSYTETANDATPEAGVAAANRAADRFLAELTTFVADAIAGLQCRAGG